MSKSPETSGSLNRRALLGRAGRAAVLAAGAGLWPSAAEACGLFRCRKRR